MAKKYCTQCGAENHYTVTPPKFCQECRHPFDENAFASAPAPQPAMAHTSPFTPAPAQPAIQPMSNQPVNQDEADIAAINAARQQNTAVAFEMDEFHDNSVTIGNEVGQGALGMPKRKRYAPRNGSAHKDILEMCKPVRESKEIG